MVLVHIKKLFIDKMCEYSIHMNCGRINTLFIPECDFKFLLAEFLIMFHVLASVLHSSDLALFFKGHRQQLSQKL